MTQETMGGAGVEAATSGRNGVPPEPGPCLLPADDIKKKNRRKYAPEDIVRFLCCVGLVAGVGHDPTTSGL